MVDDNGIINHSKRDVDSDNSNWSIDNNNSHWTVGSKTARDLPTPVVKVSVNIVDDEGVTHLKARCRPGQLRLEYR
jgi:hypothetical protein